MAWKDPARKREYERSAKRHGQNARQRARHREKNRLASKAWYDKNRDKALAYSRERYRDWARNLHYIRQYGASQSVYDALLYAQDARCAICKSESPGPAGGKKTERFQLDHCHEKDHIRGLLCAGCNKAIGLFFHDPDILREAARYIESAEDGRMHHIVSKAAQIKPPRRNAWREGS
jgi:hypothetical protein